MSISALTSLPPSRPPAPLPTPAPTTGKAGDGDHDHGVEPGGSAGGTGVLNKLA